MTETYYSRISYNYGDSKIFTIPFDYIRQSDIHVYVNGEETNNFVFNTNSQIEIKDLLNVNDVIEIKRETPIEERVVVFTNTSILNKETQNLANEQVFYGLQEVKDDFEHSSLSAKTYMEEAKAQADNAENSANNAYNSAEEAKKWATQVPDPVEGNLHSAKYYASLFAETGQVRANYNETDPTMTSYILGRDNIKNLINKNITNCILEAPSGVFRLNAEGKYYVPKETRFLSANGIDINGNIKNLDITLSSDVVFSQFENETLDYAILFLMSLDGGTTWQANYRGYTTYWFVQNTEPNTTDGTWYNPKDKKWRNIQAPYAEQWYEFNIIPIALVSLKNYLVDKVYKIFEPIELLTNSTCLPNANAVNYNNATAIPFNTMFTAPTDGKIFVYSNIHVEADSVIHDSLCNCVGFIDPIISGADNVITKTASQEYRNSGTYTFNAPANGWYKFILVGGGGSEMQSINVYGVMRYGGGGSGAAFMGEIYLTAGNHTITVGGANGATSIDGLVIAGAGGNASMPDYVSVTAGAGGIISVTGQTRNVTMQSNGNVGATAYGSACAGGASLYNGWGAGASSNSSPATGYAYVEYSYQETVSSRTILGPACYVASTFIHWDGSSNIVATSQSSSSWIDIEKGQKIYFTTTESMGNHLLQVFYCYFYPNKSEVQ